MKFTKTVLTLAFATAATGCTHGMHPITPPRPMAAIFDAAESTLLRADYTKIQNKTYSSIGKEPGQAYEMIYAGTLKDSVVQEIKMQCKTHLKHVDCSILSAKKIAK